VSVSRLVYGLALVLLALHLMLPLLAAVAHAGTGGAAGGAAASLKRLGYLFASMLASIGAIAYALGRSDIAKSSWAVVVAATAWALSYTGGLGGTTGQAQMFWPLGGACPPPLTL